PRHGCAGHHSRLGGRCVPAAGDLRLRHQEARHRRVTAMTHACERAAIARPSLRPKRWATSWGIRMRTLLVCAAFVLAACGGGVSATARPIAAPLSREAGGWAAFTPQAPTIDGETLDPTCSDAPGADAAFKFWARRGVSNNLIIYFDGGGACWDDLTCSVPRLASHRGEGDGFYKAELMPDDDPNNLSGIFDLDNPRNPVRDWSFVFVPYCTGDVHSGSNTATYTNPRSEERR